MRRFRLLYVLVFALATFGIGAKGCDGDLVDDPTFKDWCGDRLCAWKLEAGSVRRAPTWNAKDYGVELVDTPTAISQSVSDHPRCLVFTTVADVEPAAQVTIGLDFDRDGTIDHEESIAATGFRQAKAEISAPLFYDGFRFVITKKGAGRAVLAQMRVQQRGDCTAPPLALHDLPLGATCPIADPASCRSGVCCAGVCSECCVQTNPGQILPDGGAIFSSPVACGGGGECKVRASGVRGFFLPSVPWQCDPGKKSRAPGDVCLADDDCASGACDGASAEAFQVALDGGVSDCPGARFPDAGAEGCTFSRVSEGRCR